MGKHNIKDEQQSQNRSKRLKIRELAKGYFRNRRTDILGQIRSVLDGTILTRESFLKQFAFVLFLSSLTLLYIAQNFFADKILLAIEREREHIKELRFEYVVTSERLTRILQASELKEKLKPYGLKPSIVPPVKIIIPKDKTKR